MGDDDFGHEPEEQQDDPLLPDSLRDGAADAGADADAEAVSRIPHRYRRSLGASALAAGMIGLRDVLEDPKDDRPVVEHFADEGDRERPIEVDLDPDDPAASVVRLRDLDA